MYKQLPIYIFYYTMMKKRLLCKCEICLTNYIEKLHKMIHDLQEEKLKLVEELQEENRKLVDDLQEEKRKLVEQLQEQDNNMSNNNETQRPLSRM